MIQPDLIPIMRAIHDGDKSRARQLLKTLLRSKPSAEAWYLASQVTEKPAHEVECLKSAVAVDPRHTDARRRLAELGVDIMRPHEARTAPTPDSLPMPDLDDLTMKGLAHEPKPAPVLSKDELAALRKSRRRKQRGTWFWVGIGGAILLGLSSTYFVMLVLGSGIPGQLRGMIFGEQPVTEIEGVPLANVPDAIMRVAPSHGTELQRSEAVAEVMEPGFVHEHVFQAYSGEELAIGVQFLSLNANRVSRNLLILDPDGREVRCQRDRILQGDNGAVLSCRIDKTGLWRLRLLGREGESTGVYVVSVERFTA